MVLFEPNRVFRGPAAHLSIVLACAEVDKASVAVVETSREAEGLEAGSAVERDIARAGALVGANSRRGCLIAGAGDVPHSTVARVWPLRSWSGSRF